jgi:hypothetical protein
VTTDDSGSELETALDELYSLDPSDFMPTRKQLVADLRAAGNAGAAKQLGAARRPTNAAWALNQLARQHPDLVDDFLAQSATLRDAQDRALSGHPDELRDATRAQREALGTATQAANAVLGKALTETYRAQIASTLQAASVDDTTAEALRQGRVIREVSGATGFPGFGAFSVPDVEPSTTTKGTPSRLPRERQTGEGKARETGDRKTREERARAESELASAEGSLREAADAVTTAEQSAAAANERVERLRRELDDARREAHTASDAVTHARRAARDGAKAVELLRRSVEKLSEKES